MSRRVFADTSALYAFLVDSDANHHRARRAFAALAAERALLVTTSYVLVESYALLARRIGRGAVARFRADLAPLLDVTWVDEPTHERALDLLLEHPSGDLSLVDAASFLIMRRHRLDEALAFDRHFLDEGFTLVA